MKRVFCDECGAELKGAAALNGGADQDRLVAEAGPRHAPLQITVLLRRRHGVDMCRRCMLDYVAKWLESERGL